MGEGTLGPRFQTGIERLDEILSGGLFENSVHIIQGGPGSGKTILANQICFHQAKAGRRVVYLTLLAESHDRMLRYLSKMSFVDLALLPDRMCYLSGYSSLRDQGAQGLLDLVRDIGQKTNPDVLVLDGLYMAHEQIASKTEFLRLLYELMGEAGLHECTMLLLTNNPSMSRSPEHTIVDVVIQLEDHLQGARAFRTLTVQKFRGSAHLRGRHLFRITADGLEVYPRMESRAELPHQPVAGERLRTGVAGLDRMMWGGVPARSSTLLVGPAGIGKTSFGLMFLGQATPEEPGLLLGCYETPEVLRFKASNLGIDIDGMIAAGALRIVWEPPLERYMDELGDRLITEVRNLSARRVFVDGGGAFRLTAAFPERLASFFGALALQMQALGSTTFITSESWGLHSPEASVLEELSPFADNVLLLRFIEHESRLARVASLTKVRSSGFDTSILPFEITGNGSSFLSPIDRVEDLLGHSQAPSGGPRRSG
jgi:circadian clock protein KaiC